MQVQKSCKLLGSETSRVMCYWYIMWNQEYDFAQGVLYGVSSISGFAHSLFCHVLGVVSGCVSDSGLEDGPFHLDTDNPEHLEAVIRSNPESVYMSTSQQANMTSCRNYTCILAQKKPHY
ncbi:Hypothetical predicted protein [Pelobates cultripes]|uniref:Uncharacterized protein n=1 Tax=Pelobates cultripes TaxID=61616 RepID=A0AAD1VJS5_PELCU|nr:Hypothetical predicted protein [Pelobates cultripes]